ncbi:MAG: non-canonical purine NTP pyrophosphatase [Armatimonadetes bacterium]|nr:non-canonical purine NTP pyrophosphatase [Armatimonadota bacterium]
MPATRILHLGTSNSGKIAEMAALLAPLGWGLAPVRAGDEVPEVGRTFEENSAAKALAWADRVQGLTLSDDSGLAVTALEGLPGVWSARFADLDLATRGIHSSGRSREEMDAANNQRVLSLLEGVPQPRRAAVMMVVVTLARPGEVLFSASGECHGWIETEPRGRYGFGYDPIFVGQDTFGRTFAELDPMRKNLRSHRKRVLDQLFMWLSQNGEGL